MQSFKQFVLYESNLGRVFQHSQKNNMSTITAFKSPEWHGLDKHNPDDQLKALVLNRARNKSLKSDIEQAGFGYIPVKGRYVENYGSEKATPVDEESFILTSKPEEGNKLLDFSKQMGEKYHQDSILHKFHNEPDATLHGTKPDATEDELQYGKTWTVGDYHPNKAGMFHTILKNKKTFEFSSPDLNESVGNSNFELIFPPLSFSSRFGLFWTKGSHYQ